MTRSMEFELCSLHVVSSNRPKFMYLGSVLYVLGVIRKGGVGHKTLSSLSYLYYISCLCSGVFVECDIRFGMCWGHVTDVPRTGFVRMDSETRHVSFFKQQ